MRLIIIIIVIRNIMKMNDLPKPMPPPSAPMMIPTENVVIITDDHATNEATAAAYRNELLRQGYTPGLISAIQKNRPKHNKLQFVTCSRWKEMVQTVEYHVNMAALIQAPTTFRLLNHPGQQVGSQIFSIATTTNNNGNRQSMIDHDMAVAMNIMNQAQPNGVTPLTEHINAIRQSIENMVPQLYANGQKVAIVLATDGLPTDAYGNSNEFTNQQFRDALKSLEGLPVWIVVRLCTDEEAIVNFWNELDAQLEVSLEVLDDYVSEGQEIYQMNPWLTYGLPLHRMREMGFYNRLFDLLDEQPLSKSDIRDFVHLLFGPFDTPDPDLDWDRFCTTVERIQQQQQQFNKVPQWNPVLQKLMPWIDIRKLRQHNKPSSWFGLW